MAILYPNIISIIVSKNELIDYFVRPKIAFSIVYDTMTSLAIADIVILSGGLAGTIVSGIVIKMLRRRGYQMF